MDISSKTQSSPAEYLFAIGFVSILGQVVLLRELNVASYGIELIYTLAFGVWLFSTACGTMISRSKRQPSAMGINLLLVLLSVGFLMEVAFVRSARLMLGNTPGAYLPLDKQIALILASLMPIGLMLGLLFQWAATMYVVAQKPLALAYSIESIGGLAGGICGTLFLKLGLENLYIGLICALASVAASFLESSSKGTRWLRAVSIAVILLLAVLCWKASAINYLMTSWNHPDVVATADSPYSRITITLLDGQVSVFENDALSFNTEGTKAEEFVQIAAVQQPRPDRVLILGGGIQGTVREILQHQPRVVDYVELNPALVDTVQPYLPLEIQKSLRARNVRIIIEDPRRFLERALNYDLILVGMPEPDSGQTNRFYTREFFQQCLDRLNDQGVIAFRLQSSENFWPPLLARRMISIYRALRSVFPQVIVVPGSTNVVLGSRHSLTENPAVMAARLDSRHVRTRLVSSAYLRYVYQNDRFQEIAKILASGTAPTNTDIRPICYQYTMLIWLSKFLPGTRFWNFSFLESWSIRSVVLYWILVLSVPALLLARARWPVRRAILSSVAGFSGMVLEIVAILHFQTKNGILYQDLGILLTAFMAGLALGARACTRSHPDISRMPGMMMLSGLALLSGGTGLIINSGRTSGLAETSGLLFLAGFFTAGIFAYASLRKAEDQRSVITPLYSADLIGGCAGSIIATLIIVPMFGLLTATQLLVPLAIFSALLL
jgi:spermidine synthase